MSKNFSLNLKPDKTSKTQNRNTGCSVELYRL